jgi:cell division protein FtsW
MSQMIINIGMVLALLPVIGIPLPLVSYGGSALVPSLVALGCSSASRAPSRRRPRRCGQRRGTPTAGKAARSAVTRGDLRRERPSRRG